MARRPTDFKSANTIEHIATKGLPVDRHIGPDEKTSKITLTSWVNSTRSYMEERGLDTVFYVYDGQTDTETYLLTDWGSASPAKIEKWVATLRAGVPRMDGTISPRCDYDLDNLKWSGKAILNSVSLPLWETVEKDLGVDASGPEAFAAVVYKLQQVSSAAVRALVDELKALSLLKEPGQDVEIFGGRVVELCRRISGTGSAPADLVVLAAGTFLECDVLAFKLKAIKIHDEVDENANSMSWDSVVRSLKTKYQSLKGQGLWTPQATTKKKDDELSGLHAAINKLTAQVQNGGAGDGNGGTRCYNCNEMGHMSRDCPRNRTSSGSRVPPKDGEPQTKTIDGASQSWCGVCRRWTKGDKEHLTAGHVRRERAAPGPGPTPAPAPAPAPAQAPVLAPAVGGLEGSTPYNGGSLHLQNGLFVGTLAAVGMNNTSHPNLGARKVADASICPDDFFHVAGRESNQSETSESHQLFVATSNGTNTVSNPMTDFLTAVAQARKVSGSNVESWVTAVENKLADIGILTISGLVESIPTLNSRLFQVGHVPMFIRTLAIMSRKGVSRISMPDESSSEAYNTHEMTSFLRSVAEKKGITGAHVETWIGQVRRKLHKIGITSVRGTIGTLILLNRKLRAANLQMFHSQTIEIMAKEGVESLRKEAEELSGFVQATEPVIEAGNGWCSTCHGPGEIGQACTTCDNGMFLNFPAGY
jgi:transcriptional regulator NrdR family protein